ncbi:MAG TPA: PilZ domain-containing protein [Candidatus Dormibacteraeota bacterium]|nr:PilZ domain-containing protein [Candidatus Dormibacteraeota bacterium]
MSEGTLISPRRSRRIFHRMGVQAQGRSHNGRKFREICETVVISDHGGLLFLKHEIDNGELLVLTNPETLEEQECRVVFLGNPGDRGQRVGVEFLTPAPRFWCVEFDDDRAKASAPDSESGIH